MGEKPGQLQFRPNDQLYWRPEMESIFGTEQMREIQTRRVQERVRIHFEHAPYFRRRMQASGVTHPNDVKTLEDFARAAEPFRKTDYRKLLLECDSDINRVMNELLHYPLSDIVLLAATSGTTGAPQPYPMTRVDLDDLYGEWIMRFRWRAGLRPGDRIVHAAGLSMFFAGLPMLSCTQPDGITQIPIGAEAGAQRILNIAKVFSGTVLFCTPSLAEHLIERAPEILGAPISSLGIHTVLCGGEPGAGVPSVRRHIEKSYNAKLYDFGAGMGISCDHPEYQGMHWVADDLMLYELVEPGTNNPVPLVDGAEGEAVMTTLLGGGLAQFRLGTGDIHQVMVSPCPCGKTGIRFKIVGRIDDMLKVKGAIVYPAAVDEVISTFIPRVTGEFRIQLDEPPPRVVPPLRLRVERGVNTPREALPALEEEISRKMRDGLRFTPKIEWLEPNTLPRTGGKTKFIEVAGAT